MHPDVESTLVQVLIFPSGLLLCLRFLRVRLHHFNQVFSLIFKLALKSGQEVKYPRCSVLLNKPATLEGKHVATEMQQHPVRHLANSGLDQTSLLSILVEKSFE